MNNLKADVTISDYHLKFVQKVNIKYIKEVKKLERILKAKEDTYYYLNEHIEEIKQNLKINLEEYKEYNTKTYNENEELIKDIKYLFKKEQDNRENIIAIIKYCNVIKAEKQCRLNIEKYDKERHIGLREYEYLISKFFYKVHDQLLDGDCYKLGSGLGQMYIERIETSGNSKKIDFVKTKERKQYLIDNGYKVYNKTEARLAKEAGIEYDGIDYRVRLSNRYIDRIVIDKSKYFSAKSKYYIRYIDYVAPELRNITYEQIKTEYRTIREIYKLRLSLKRKLSVILANFPEHGINYMRK